MTRKETKMLTPKDNLLKVYHHEIPEYIPDIWQDTFNWWIDEVIERGPVKDNPLGGEGADWFGVHWRYIETARASTPDPDYPHILTDITQWKEQVKFPDLDAIDWAAAWERDKNNPNYDPDKLVSTTFLNGPFERLHALMGMEDALVALMLEPEACREFFDAMVDFKISLLDHIMEYYPIDLLEAHDDYGHQTNLFMPIETWRELLMEPMSRLAAHCKEKGIIFRLHSCGKNETLIPSIVEAGIENWSSVQQINDIAKILTEFGDRLTLQGGGSNFFNYPCPKEDLTEDIARAVLNDQLFRFCRGGAFIPGVRNPEIFDIYCKMKEEYKDFYKDPANCEFKFD